MFWKDKRFSRDSAGSMRARSRTPLTGWACRARFPAWRRAPSSVASAAGGSHRHLCTTSIEAAQPGDVIVVEQRTGIEAAARGGMLSNAAKRRGLAGVIVEGLPATSMKPRR
jgi:hypothetical protein